MKKLLTILLMLPLLCSWASASLCVRLDTGALLLDRDGNEILSLGIYEDIIPLGNGFYAARQDENYALMNADGIILSEFCYDFLEVCDKLLVVENDGLYGLLSFEGAPLTPMEYTRILPAGNGCFWAIRGDGNDLESDELLILDISGNETSTGLFIRRMQAANNEMLAVLLPSSGQWGYCDTQGKIIIPARYDYAGPFLHNRVAVVENGLYGVISPDGESIIKPAYDYLEICAGGFVLAGLNQQGIWVFDLSGNEIARYAGEETAAAPVGDGYAVYGGEAVILYSNSGEILIRSEQGTSISEGLNGQFILSNGPWGEKCVSIAGSESVYQNLYPLGYANNEPIYAYMEANSARFINDLLGEVQVSADMESARYGVVNAQGEMLIPAEFEFISALDDNRLLCQVNDYRQVMDIDGNIYWTHGFRQIEEPIS